MSGAPDLFISRAELRRDAAVRALAKMLLPDSAPGRASAAHGLIWSLMSNGPQRKRDFLWREEQPGKFIILSRRPPAANVDLFDLDSKPFDPALRAGQALRFVLRANPTASHRATGGETPGPRGKRHDLVMHALYHVPKADRAAVRPAVVRDTVTAWLVAHGKRAGFELREGCLIADGYRQLRLPRPGAKPMVIACVECEGIIEISDPVSFRAALAEGFGRARAFGCGLMLIRRA